MTAGATELADRASGIRLRRVDPDSPVAVAAVRAYLVEIDRRLPQGLDVEAALAADQASRDTATWVFVVATTGAEPIAGGGVRVLETDAPCDERRVGEIKRMWVHPAWRGAGLGGRLLRRLEDEARDLGLTTVRLDTHRALIEAVAMYERVGYREIARYYDNPNAQAWFEKRLATVTSPG